MLVCDCAQHHGAVKDVWIFFWVLPFETPNGSLWLRGIFNPLCPSHSISLSKISASSLDADNAGIGAGIGKNGVPLRPFLHIEVGSSWVEPAH